MTFSPRYDRPEKRNTPKWLRLTSRRISNQVIMKTLRIRVDGVWSELMSEEQFLQDLRGLEIDAVEINEQLTREECRKRYPERFARFEKQYPLTKED